MALNGASHNVTGEPTGPVTGPPPPVDENSQKDLLAGAQADATGQSAPGKDGGDKDGPKKVKTEKELEKERNVIKEELAMYLDQPQHHVLELLNETLWPNQPLGRSLTGTIETLDALTRKELLAFQRRNYVSGSTLIAAAGKLKPAPIIAFA